MTGPMWLCCVLCLTGLWSAVSATSCPALCTCNDHLMECDQVQSFPTGIPANLTHFRFTKSFLDSNVLPKVPMEYSGAEYMAIDKSPVTTLPTKAFSALTNLKTLEFTGSRITEIKAEHLEGMSSLTKLGLIGNKLDSIGSGVFTVLETLEILELKGNKNIKLVHDVFSGVAKLHRVNLEHCNLTEVPHISLGSATALTSLYFGGNPLAILKDGAFADLNNVKELHLDGCHINSISEAAFSGVPHLTELHISHNNLSEIPDNAFHSFSDQLRSFYVDSNRLTTLSSSLIPWPQLKNARFGHNPWLCDCDITWMRQLDLDIVDNHENVTCASPQSLAGRKITNVTIDELCDCGSSSCGNQSNTIALAIGIPIVIICVLLIGYYIYKMIQSKRQKEQDRKGVRYSAVYKDTTERGGGGGGGGYPHA